MKQRLYQDAHLHIKPGSKADSFPQISRIFLNSTSTEDYQTVRQASAAKVIPFYGIHPWFIKDNDNSLDLIETEITAADISGIGECGLDFSSCYKDSRELQIRVFRLQLELANRYSCPVSIHCVKAWESLTRALQDFHPLKAPFIMHSFYGSKEIVGKLIKFGGYISISALSLKNSDKSYPVINAVPDNRLLIESDICIGDGDYTIDKHLKILENNYKTVSEIKGISVDNLKEMVWNNGSIFTNRETSWNRKT